MERAEWLKQMRDKAEKLYDLIAPQYWVDIGLHQDESTLKYLRNFLGRIPPHGNLLSAGCGAGRYDGVLLEAGHRVFGIDQSEGMLARAREHFPEARYEKMTMQDLEFREEFDGAICIEALEHVFPEDWPGIMRGFSNALKPGGVLYFTADLAGGREKAAYERAKAMGYPVVLGEVADQVEELFEQMVESGGKAKTVDENVYHYCPPVEQVREWIEKAGMAIEEEEVRKEGGFYVVGYFVTRKV
ncbi:MAG: class I SAM-dependent methyltransferase [Dehalococcoidales bacterium]|nr:MAG: class I SAM-dependent methyltransferase [Dehalococcoidales bacterium]